MILYFATNNNFVHVKVLVMLRNHQPVMRCTPCVHRVTQGEERLCRGQYVDIYVTAAQTSNICPMNLFFN